VTIYNRLRTIYWRLYFRLHGAEVGRRFQVHGPIQLLLRDGASLRNLHIGDDVTFNGKVQLGFRKQGRITLGSGVRVSDQVAIAVANEAAMIVGDRTLLGPYNVFNAGHGIAIGSDCLLAAFVYVNSSDYVCRRDDRIANQGYVGAPIVIGDDVWLGGHVFVGKGVTIGTGAVLGAGAIVVKDIAPYAIAVGNPARAVKQRM
jgi:acetyltransferase-like isoleucine patch superfamily enzyme